MKIEDLLPIDGPSINEVSKYIDKYKNDLIVIKYGGNVFIDRNIFNNFIEDISVLNKLGLSIVVIHGGGPRIKRELDKSNIQSKFIKGLRVTDEKIINIVEDVLIDFNKDIVNSLKEKNTEAVSIHTKKNNVIEIVQESKELGFVGKPNKINNDIDLIKNIYRVKGFNNITVSVSTEKFSDDRVNLIFYIKENDQSQIERITFKGNQTFSDRYLLSLVNTKTRNFYNIFTFNYQIKLI